MYIISRYGLKEGVWNNDIIKFPPNNFYHFTEYGYRCTIWRDPIKFYLCGSIEIPFDDMIFDIIGLDMKTLDNINNLLPYLDFHWYITHKKIITTNKKKYLKVCFDCLHYGDLIPIKLNKDTDKIVTNVIYRDYDFVEKKLKNSAIKLYFKQTK